MRSRRNVQHIFQIVLLVFFICTNFTTAAILAEQQTSGLSNSMNRDLTSYDSRDDNISLLESPEFQGVLFNETVPKEKKMFQRTFVALYQRRNGPNLPPTDRWSNRTSDYTVLLRPSSSFTLNPLTTKLSDFSKTKATIFPSSYLAALSAEGPAGASSPARLPPSLLVAHPIAAALIFVVVLAMILITMVGNCMLCMTICVVRKLKQQPANLLLISLAVADFSVGLIVMPIALVGLLEQRWILGELMCRLWTFADLTLCTASILNLCLISVDRYLAVTRTLQYAIVRTRRRMLLYVGIVWVSALLVSATPLIFFSTGSIPEQTCQVSQNPVYQLYATMISFYVPCLIMVIVYGKMWRAAKRIQQRDRRAFNCSVRPSLQSAGGVRRRCDSNKSGVMLASSSVTMSPGGRSRVKRNNNKKNNNKNKNIEFDCNNNTKNCRNSPARLPFLLSRWWEVKKRPSITNCNNGNAKLIPNGRRRSTVMMMDIPESATIDEDMIGEHSDEQRKIYGTSPKANNQNEINNNEMPAERWQSENELPRIIADRPMRNSVSDSARHSRRKFRQMFSSPVLFSDVMMGASTSSVTAMVAAAVVHRIQRSSALLSAVRMQLLRASHDKGEDKARKTLGVIMSVFIVCWLPFFILALVKPQYPQYSIPNWLDMVVLWLGYSNSMLNPLIYCKYNREFRVPFREMLCCRFRTLQVVMRNESFYSKFGPPNIVAELRNLDTSHGAIPFNGHSGEHFDFGALLSLPFATSRLLHNAGSKRNSSPCAIELMRGRPC